MKMAGYLNFQRLVLILGDIDRAHFIKGVSSMTGESELGHLVSYLISGDRSTEKDSMVMGGSYYVYSAECEVCVGPGEECSSARRLECLVDAVVVVAVVAAGMALLSLDQSNIDNG